MGFLYSQLVQTLPRPTQSCKGRTVVVTGSNSGLGKEAARHFASLGATKIILAVRNTENGKIAADDIAATTKVHKSVIDVWQLDMGSYESVRQFAKRVKLELPRLDIFVANAGVAKTKFNWVEDNEESITVNVIGTLLLTLLVLPKMKATARQHKAHPTLTITSSEVHGHTTFPDRMAPQGQIFKAFGNRATTDMADRYPVSKLLELLGVRAFAERYPALNFPVTINCVNPGLCHSELAREAGLGLTIIKALLARTAEAGSRTLVHAACSGPETHGHYLSDCKIELPSDFVLSADGRVAQNRVWEELTAKLEELSPGVLSRI